MQSRSTKKHMINSRTKGKVGERAVASYLRDRGFGGARRGQQFSGGNESPDVVGVPGYHIEVKWCKTMKMRDWVAQAEGDCGGQPWLLFHRWNHGPWLVTMKADDFPFEELIESGDQKHVTKNEKTKEDRCVGTCDAGRTGDTDPKCSSDACNSCGDAGCDHTDIDHDG